MGEPVRVRVVFEDCCVPTKSQTSAGLRRSWVLLKPDLATIGDLAAHLALRFALRTDSAADIFLSMDGCVLPPFESTSIFKDKDFIRVRRNNLCMKVVTETVNLEEQPVVMSQKFLAKKNSTEDSHGYKNKAEDDAYAINDNTIPVNIPPDENVNSRRKRKHSDVLQDSKRKKLKSTSVDRHDATCEVPIVTAPKSSHRRAKPSKGDVTSALVASQADDEVKKTPVSRKPLRQRNDHDVAKCQTKLPSRNACWKNACWKKARRQWPRKWRKTQAEHKESQIPANDIRRKSPEGERINQNNGTVTEDDTEVVPDVIRPGHICFEPVDAEPSKELPNGQVSLSPEESVEHTVQKETIEVTAPAPVSNLKMSENVTQVNNWDSTAPEDNLNVTVNNLVVATAPAINMKVALPQNTVAEKVAPVAIPQNTVVKKVTPVAIPQNTVVEKATPVDTWEAAAPENVPEKVAPVNYCEVVAPGNVLEKASSTDIRGEMNIVNTSSTDKLESPAVNWGAPSSILDKKSDNWVSNNLGASSSNANKKPAPFSERSWVEQMYEALIEKKAELEKNGGWGEENGGWGEKRAELQKNGGWGGRRDAFGERGGASLRRIAIGGRRWRFRRVVVGKIGQQRETTSPPSAVGLCDSISAIGERGGASLRRIAIGFRRVAVGKIGQQRETTRLPSAVGLCDSISAS